MPDTPEGIHKAYEKICEAAVRAKFCMSSKPPLIPDPKLDSSVTPDMPFDGASRTRRRERIMTTLTKLTGNLPLKDAHVTSPIFAQMAADYRAGPKNVPAANQQPDAQSGPSAAAPQAGPADAKAETGKAKPKAPLSTSKPAVGSNADHAPKQAGAAGTAVGSPATMSSDFT